MPTDLLTPAAAPADASATAGAAVPVFLDLDRRRVLLVGGGAEALTQLTTVLADHPTACVTVVAPALLPDLRTTLVLREMEQLSYDEVAAVMQVPVGTVRSRLHTARERFRHLWLEANKD